MTAVYLKFNSENIFKVTYTKYISILGASSTITGGAKLSAKSNETNRTNFTKSS